MVEAFARYGVDGVMIGRAGSAGRGCSPRRRPRSRGEPIPPDPTLAEQRQLLLDHYRLVVERFGPVKGTILMRGYACCYGQGRQGARAFRREIAQAATHQNRSLERGRNARRPASLRGPRGAVAVWASITGIGRDRLVGQSTGGHFEKTATADSEPPRPIITPSTA